MSDEKISGRFFDNREVLAILDGKIKRCFSVCCIALFKVKTINQIHFQDDPEYLPIIIFFSFLDSKADEILFRKKIREI